MKEYMRSSDGAGGGGTSYKKDGLNNLIHLQPNCLLVFLVPLDFAVAMMMCSQISEISLLRFITATAKTTEI